jgi:hypothetical protein
MKTGLLRIAAVMAVFSTLALAGCSASVSVTPPLALTAPTPAAADMESRVLRAVWDYVHTHYPLQPWPDKVYILPDQDFIAARGVKRIHVVMCRHATGFLWEGEVLWRAGCNGGCVVVEEVRECYIVLPPTATPELQPG